MQLRGNNSSLLNLPKSSLSQLSISEIKNLSNIDDSAEAEQERELIHQIERAAEPNADYYELSSLAPRLMLKKEKVMSGKESIESTMTSSPQIKTVSQGEEKRSGILSFKKGLQRRTKSMKVLQKYK